MPSGVEQGGATRDLLEEMKIHRGVTAVEQAENKWAIVSVLIIARMQAPNSKVKRDFSGNISRYHLILLYSRIPLTASFLFPWGQISPLPPLTYLCAGLTVNGRPIWGKGVFRHWQVNAPMAFFPPEQGRSGFWWSHRLKEAREAFFHGVGERDVWEIFCKSWERSSFLQCSF